MQRSRQRRGAQGINSALRLKVEAVVVTEAIRGAGRAEEIDEVGAAAEQHVLAIVDWFGFTGGNKGRGAAPQYRPLFDELDGVAGLGKTQRRRHARQAPAENRYASTRQSGLPPTRSCSRISTARMTRATFPMFETAAVL